jgi:hypothetical protein
LKIRIDLPSERAASGSFLAPKSSTNTAMTINQCQGCRPPNLVTSRRLNRVYLPGLSAPTSYADNAAMADSRTRSASDSGSSTRTAEPKPRTKRAIHSSEA